MRKKPVMLGLLATATGLAALGTAGAQAPPPGGYGTPAGGGYAPARVAPAPAGTYPATYVRPYSDWTPGAPQAGYTPTQPPPQPQTQSQYPNRPALAGIGMSSPSSGGGAPLPPPSLSLAQPTNMGAVSPGGVQPAAALDIPPPNFDFPPTPASPGLTRPMAPMSPALPTPSMDPVGDAKFPTPPSLPAGMDVKPALAMPAPVALPAGPLDPTPPVAATPITPPAASQAPKLFPAPAAVPAMPTATAVPAAPTPATTTVNKPAAPSATLPTPPAAVPAPPAALPTPGAGVPAVTGSSLPNRLTPSVVVEAFAPETVSFGQEFKYELLVRNVGQVGVTGVRVEDEMPAGAKYLGSEPAAEVNGDRLSWNVGAIEGGADRRIVVRIKPSEEGDIRSRATVSFSTAVDAKTKVTRPKISVALSGPEVARVGEEAPFIIKVTNTGSGPAVKLMLKATLTEGLFCPKVPSAGGNEIQTVLTDVKPGETKSLRLPVAAAQAGSQNCQVVASAEGSPDSSARVSVNVVEPLLQIKQSGPGRCLVRAEPVYTIELSNPGTASTDPVQVYAVLPDGFEYVQASDGGAFNGTTRAVTWRLPSLPAGGTRPVSLKLRAAAAADGLLRTVAQSGTEPAAPGAVVGASAKDASRTLEAKAETAVRAEGVPAIRFEVAGADGVVEVGKEAVYDIRVINQGTGPCTNVQLVASLAEGTTYTGSSGPSQVKAQGQQLLFEPIPQLGVKAELVYRVRLRATQPGDLRVHVQLTCDQVTNPVVKEESTRFYKE